MRRSQTDQDGKLKQLTKEVERVAIYRSNQLYEAVRRVWNRWIHVDCSKQNTGSGATAGPLLSQSRGFERRLKQMPMDALERRRCRFYDPERLIEKDRSFSKYLKLLVDEIRCLDKQLVMKGSYAALARWWGKLKGHPREWSAQF